jgi:hypothetical protein
VCVRVCHETTGERKTEAKDHRKSASRVRCRVSPVRGAHSPVGTHRSHSTAVISLICDANLDIERRIERHSLARIRETETHETLVVASRRTVCRRFAHSTCAYGGQFQLGESPDYRVRHTLDNEAIGSAGSGQDGRSVGFAFPCPCPSLAARPSVIRKPPRAVPEHSTSAQADEEYARAGGLLVLPADEAGRRD